MVGRQIGAEDSKGYLTGGAALIIYKRAVPSVPANESAGTSE